MNKIAGIITTTYLDTPKEMQRMLRSMALPSAPKESGLFQYENFTLGHTESNLFYNLSQTHYLLLDGEINNGPQIKQRLLDAGQMIVSDKIEDLLILSYQTWGEDSFRYANGAFIIVIFDKNQRKIVIGRDRLGSKTLFWTRIGNHFIFASKLKGLLAASIVPQVPDLNSISSYFFLGYFAQDKTPIANVNRLLPGYYIEINENENIVINKYWNFSNLSFDTSKYKEEEVYTKIDRLLLDAIKNRKDFKNQICFLNNGDIGSATIAKHLKKVYPASNKSFSISFEGQFDKSSPYIQKYCNQFGFTNTDIKVKPEDMLSEIQQLVWHLDEPIADPQAISIWNLAKKLKGTHTSIYSSLGSSEFLGSHMGQNSLSYEPLFLWFLYLSKPFLLKGAIPLMGKIDRKLSLKALRFFQRDFWSVEYLKQQALFSPRTLKKIAPKLKGLFDLNLFLQQSYQHLKFILYQNFQVEDYLFYDAETTLSNRLLIQHENLFEAHGIKFYTPFLDFDFLEYIIGVPEPFKSRGKKGGLPLYKILEPDLKPEQICNFEQRSPWFLNHWFNHPKIRDMFMLLTKGVLVESEIINKKNLEAVLGAKPWKVHQFERMWSILVLEIWFNLFVNNPIYNYPKAEPVRDFFAAQKLITLK